MGGYPKNGSKCQLPRNVKDTKACTIVVKAVKHYNRGLALARRYVLGNAPHDCCSVIPRKPPVRLAWSSQAKLDLAACWPSKAPSELLSKAGANVLESSESTVPTKAHQELNWHGLLARSFMARYSQVLSKCNLPA